MKAFVRKHKRKIIVGHGIGIAILVLSGILGLQDNARTTVFFMPRGGTTVPSGEAVVVDVLINTRTAVNVVGATVTVSPLFDIISIDKTDSALELWTEERVDHDTGDIRFSGGTPRRGGLIGNATLLTLSLKARQAGDATLELHNVEAFASDGRGAVVETASRSLKYTVHEAEEHSASSGGGGGQQDTPLAPNPDVNNDGVVSLIDISIMTIKILGAYNPLYDLNQDGSLGIPDLSFLFSHL
jgi:hypothetical protein